MAAVHLQCKECGAIGVPLVPAGWYHITSREQRIRRWVNLCPSCGHPRVGEPTERAAPNPELDLANLKTQWDYASSHRERSQIEGKMWELALIADLLTKDQRHRGCVPWLTDRLQARYREVKSRSMLRNCEPDVNALWARIDGAERMMPKTATDVLQRAKLRAQAEATSLDKAIDSELAVYDTWQLRITPEGTFRKRPQRTRGFARQRYDLRPSKKQSEVMMARDLWASVRAAVKRVVDHELRDIADERTKERLRGQIEAELESAMHMLQSRVKRARETSYTDAPVVDVTFAVESREALKNACITLSVDAPPSGEHVDLATYMAAKKNYKKLVRTYHPDQGGDVALYQSVVEAMRTVEDSYQSADTHANRGDES
jgi:hypothetical protein